MTEEHIFITCPAECSGMFPLLQEPALSDDMVALDLWTSLDQHRPECEEWLRVTGIFEDLPGYPDDMGEPAQSFYEMFRDAYLDQFTSTIRSALNAIAEDVMSRSPQAHN